MSTKQDNQLLPAYLVVGDDALKREAVIRRLKMRLEGEGDLSFNYDAFDGATAEPQNLITACLTMPFASEKRLVQINNADKLKKASSDALVEYFSEPNPTTVVLVIAEKLAKNSRLYKSILALGASSIIECAMPKSYKLQAQVRAMAPTHGITITDEAASKLIELVGEDTVRLDNEIKKIALAHRGSDVVNESEIIEMVSHTAEVKPWEFVDAFSQRNLQQCIQYFPRVINNTSHGLLTMCVTRLRELMCAKSIIRRGGYAQKMIAQELGVPDWKVKNHVRWADLFSDVELRDALVASFDTERKMKGGSQPDATFMEWVIRVLKK